MTNKVRQFGLIYGITAIVFFLIDLVWIGVTAKDLYAGTSGGALRVARSFPVTAGLKGP
jgi:uncharacterized membrane protein